MLPADVWSRDQYGAGSRAERSEAVAFLNHLLDASRGKGWWAYEVRVLLSPLFAERCMLFLTLAI